jgi:glutamate racemase
MKIGVFDSGIGGLSVANSIGRAIPEIEVVFRYDTADHFPYANKSPDQIYEFVIPIFKQLIEEGCEVIVVACNTVTTTLIDRLRKQFSVPLVGIEPMVKPAAERTKSGVVTVCATPATLASERYHKLKRAYANNITVIEPDCSDWSERQATTFPNTLLGRFRYRPRVLA